VVVGFRKHGTPRSRSHARSRTGCSSTRTKMCSTALCAEADWALAEELIATDGPILPRRARRRGRSAIPREACDRAVGHQDRTQRCVRTSCQPPPGLFCAADFRTGAGAPGPRSSVPISSVAPSSGIHHHQLPPPSGATPGRRGSCGPRFSSVSERAQVLHAHAAPGPAPPGAFYRQSPPDPRSRRACISDRISGSGIGSHCSGGTEARSPRPRHAGPWEAATRRDRGTEDGHVGIQARWRVLP